MTNCQSQEFHAIMIMVEIFVLFGGIFVTYAHPAHDPSLNICEQYNPIIECSKRQKREIIPPAQGSVAIDYDQQANGDDDDAGGMGPCLEQCMQDFSNAIEGVIEVRKLQPGLINPVLLNKSTFQLVCGIYSTSMSCVDSCDGDDGNKRILREVLTSLDYLCITRKEDFLTMIPCMSEAEPTLKRDCKMCGNEQDSEQLGEALMDTASGSENVDPTQTLAKLCSHISCYLNCWSRIVPTFCADCSVNPVDFMKDWTRNTLIQSLEPLKTMSQGRYYPQTCETLGNQVQNTGNEDDDT